MGVGLSVKEQNLFPTLKLTLTLFLVGLFCFSHFALYLHKLLFFPLQKTCVGVGLSVNAKNIIPTLIRKLTLMGHGGYGFECERKKYHTHTHSQTHTYASWWVWV